MEFKVKSIEEENLENAARSALKQIEDKGYAASLQAKGVEESQIRKYGFAFCGKTVLIMKAKG